MKNHLLIYGLFFVLFLANACNSDDEMGSSIEFTACIENLGTSNNTLPPAQIFLSAECSTNATVFSWDIYNDGTIDGNSSTIEFTAEKSGPLEVKLIVEDAEGQQLEKLQSITIGSNTFDEVIGGNAEDTGVDVQIDEEGNFYVLGASKSFGNGQSNAYLTKLDREGNELWGKAYEGKLAVLPLGLMMTSDNNLVIYGGTTGQDNDLDYYWEKVDFDGNTIGAPTYSNVSNPDVSFSGVEIVGQDKLFFTGIMNVEPAGEMPLMKLDLDLNHQNTTSFGGNSDEIGYQVIATDNNELLIIGETNSFLPAESIYLVKTDANGSMVWEKNYSGESGRSIVQSTDSGFLIVGHGEEANGDFSNLLIRTDGNGNETQRQILDLGENVGAFSIIPTSDGNYAVIGGTGSFSTIDKRLVLAKINEDLEVLWTKTYPDAYIGGNNLKITETPDCGFAITATIDTPANGKDIFFIKTDPEGNL